MMVYLRAPHQKIRNSSKITISWCVSCTSGKHLSPSCLLKTPMLQYFRWSLASFFYLTFSSATVQGYLSLNEKRIFGHEIPQTYSGH
jgi:hypothetical protein